MIESFREKSRIMGAEPKANVLIGTNSREGFIAGINPGGPAR
jgi:hypothetical protein